MPARPPHMTGALAPVAEEVDVGGLEVTGCLPRELTGRYLRNGPNPRPGTVSRHWFVGQGMVHGVRLAAGRAQWYRNRWVQSSTPANTHVVAHAGRVLALFEFGRPCQITPDLATTGEYDFEGRLRTAMTAHPKEDPETGELHFFGYGIRPPYLTYHVSAATGQLVTSRPIPVPGPTMMHDFAVTRNHVLWLDLPVVYDPKLRHLGMPYRWSDTYQARIGVMPRAGGAVMWHSVQPGYVFHVGNAYEDASGRIVLDAVRYSPRAFISTWARLAGHRTVAPGSGALHRWLLDPARGHVREEPLDDRGIEFPTSDDRRTGRLHRFLYAAADGGRALVKYDLPRAAASAAQLGATWALGEATFVPAGDGTAEDHGWLLTIATDVRGGPSRLVVLDASDLTVTAQVHLPRRVPAGFHGSWIPDTRLRRAAVGQ